MVHSNLKEEQQLFKQIARGDEKAFRQLFDRYNGKLSAFTFRLTKSEFNAAEIVQDIFVKLWVNRVRLAEVENPHTYIFTMAFNRTMDQLRKASAEAKMLARLWQQISKVQNSTEDSFNAKESQNLINQAVVQLSPQKQKIFRLSRYEGLNHEEIAVHLCVSKSTVKNHLVETLRHIRTYLHQHSQTLILISCFPWF